MTDGSREGRLAKAFVQLSDSLVTGYNLHDLLQTLVETCMDILEITAAGLLLRTADGRLEQLAATSDHVAALELLQLRERAGPCYDCAESGNAVAMPDIATQAAQWPAFRRSALEAGFRSMHAVPLRLRDDTIGTLNLFDTRVGTLNKSDIAAAQALADVATISILTDRAARDRSAVTEQLRTALSSRIVIEQAKGIVTASTSASIDDAFALIRGFARKQRLTVHNVAGAIVAGLLTTDALVGSPQPRRDSRKAGDET